MLYCVLASDMLGGVVLYVSRKGHSYMQNSAEREEAGTPDIVGCVRAGLVYHLHTSLPHKALEAREERMGKTLLASLHTHPRIRLLTRHHPSGAGAEEDASPTVKGIVSFVVLYGNNCGGEGGGGGVFREGLYLHHNFVAPLLNDLFGVQSRAGCACSGPYAQALLGIDAPLSARLTGSFHPSFIEEYAGGLLMALQKQDGGMRPILCGEIWRRCFASLTVNTTPIR
jgi:selenocysteine lyase/cysteine desulfurase